MPRSLSERIGQQLDPEYSRLDLQRALVAAAGWRKRRAIELLHRVGIKDHKDAMRFYQLTEGECQKVMICHRHGQPAAC